MEFEASVREAIDIEQSAPTVREKPVEEAPIEEEKEKYQRQVKKKEEEEDEEKKLKIGKAEVILYYQLHAVLGKTQVNLSALFKF